MKISYFRVTFPILYSKLNSFIFFLFFSHRNKNLKDEKYEHLTAEEMKKVQDKVDDRFNWFNQRSNEMRNCPQTKNPPVYPSQIETEKKVSDHLFVLSCGDFVHKIEYQGYVPSTKLYVFLLSVNFSSKLSIWF